MKVNVLMVIKDHATTLMAVFVGTATKDTVLDVIKVGVSMATKTNALVFIILC